MRHLGQCPSTEALPLPQCLEPSAQTGSHLAVPTIIFYVRISGTCARTLRPLRISYSITSVVLAIVGRRIPAGMRNSVPSDMRMVSSFAKSTSPDREVMSGHQCTSLRSQRGAGGRQQSGTGMPSTRPSRGSPGGVGVCPSAARDRTPGLRDEYKRIGSS